jgi:hypothetical protein
MPWDKGNATCETHCNSVRGEQSLTSYPGHFASNAPVTRLEQSPLRSSVGLDILHYISIFLCRIGGPSQIRKPTYIFTD